MNRVIIDIRLENIPEILEVKGIKRERRGDSVGVRTCDAG